MVAWQYFTRPRPPPTNKTFRCLFLLGSARNHSEREARCTSRDQQSNTFSSLPPYSSYACRAFTYMLMDTSSSLLQGMSLQTLIIASNAYQLEDPLLYRTGIAGPMGNMAFAAMHIVRQSPETMKQVANTTVEAFHRQPLHLEMLLIWKLSSQHTIKANLTSEFAKLMESQRKMRRIS